MGVEEVGRAAAVALVGELQRPLDLVPLGLDPDALAAEVHGRSIGMRPRLYSLAADARRRSSCAPGSDRSGGRRRPRAVRRPHPIGAQRPRRLQADARASCWRPRRAPARARSCSRCTSPTATAGRTTGRSRGRGVRGRLVAYCRVDPRDAAVAEARGRWTPARAASSCTRAPSGSGCDEPGGARHRRARPRAEVPVLIHAGRGIPALGQNTVALGGSSPAPSSSSPTRRSPTWRGCGA